MEAALTAAKNDVQIAYVANDGMANSVIAALKAQKLNGKVLVTGQDAQLSGIQNIITGDQSMTVYKPNTMEAAATGQVVAAYYNGTLPAGVITSTTKNSSGKDIPSAIVAPVNVDASNILTTVIKDAYVTKADVCKGITGLTSDLFKSVCS
jgi:D-xylose transport system substrate-binding protein